MRTLKHLAKNKRGIEFAISTVVMIIIAVIIFMLSISMLFKFFGSAEELEQEIDRQTKDQLMQALRSGNQLVAIPLAIKEAERGSFATFAVGIRNIGTVRKFSISTSFDGAYTPDGRPVTQKDIPFIEEKWLGNFKQQAPFTLTKGSSDVKSLPIKVDVNSAQGIQTPIGDYVFNVCVFAPEQEGAATPACTAENRRLFYTEKVYQVTIRVQ